VARPGGAERHGGDPGAAPGAAARAARRVQARRVHGATRRGRPVVVGRRDGARVDGARDRRTGALALVATALSSGRPIVSTSESFGPALPSVGPPRNARLDLAYPDEVVVAATTVPAAEPSYSVPGERWIRISTATCAIRSSAVAATRSHQ